MASSVKSANVHFLIHFLNVFAVFYNTLAVATLNGIIFSYQEILSITIDDQSGGSIQTNPASGYRVQNSCSQTHKM